jgi:hypothetical protein|tara:strand:- start:41 stop:175 length:135 start_codon:yes stop_codon:yes gene_type:complete
MIKWIKNLFCKIIGVKQCECPEKDVPVYNRKLDKINRKHKKDKE